MSSSLKVCNTSCNVNHMLTSHWSCCVKLNRQNRLLKKNCLHLRKLVACVCHVLVRRGFLNKQVTFNPFSCFFELLSHRHTPVLRVSPRPILHRHTHSHTCRQKHAFTQGSHLHKSSCSLQNNSLRGHSLLCCNMCTSGEESCSKRSGSPLMGSAHFVQEPVVMATFLDHRQRLACGPLPDREGRRRVGWGGEQEDGRLFSTRLWALWLVGSLAFCWRWQTLEAMLRGYRTLISGFRWRSKLLGLCSCI